MGVGVEQEKAGVVGILTGGSSQDNDGLGRVGSEAKAKLGTNFRGILIICKYLFVNYILSIEMGRI